MRENRPVAESGTSETPNSRWSSSLCAGLGSIVLWLAAADIQRRTPVQDHVPERTTDELRQWETLARRPRTLTSSDLEDQVLRSTPKGEVAGRELHLDFGVLEDADFQAVGRLLGAVEGFLRRGGRVRISPPPSRATVEEARILAQPTTQHTPDGLTHARADLARRVQSRSRASRFLERIGFMECAECSHLDAIPVVFDPMPVLASGKGVAESRVEPRPRVEREDLLEVVPYRWLTVNSEAELVRAVDHVYSLLDAVGIRRSVRHAIEELVINVYEHSLYGNTAVSSPGPAQVLFGAAIRETVDGSLLDILVVDGGVGIPDTLADAYQRTHGRSGTQSDVVMFAFESTSTRKSHVEGSARGLAYVLGVVGRAGGTVAVRSGTGEAVFRGGDLYPISPNPGFQPGTSFSLSIPVGVVTRVRPISEDAETIETSSLDVDAYLVAHGGSTSRLASLSPNAAPAADEVSLLLVDTGCKRVDLERAMDRHTRGNEMVLLASIEGQGAFLLGQVEAIAAARSLSTSARVIVLDGLEPVVVYGSLSPQAGRGIVRAVIDLVEESLGANIASVVEDTQVAPRTTWSLEVAARWIEPADLVNNMLARTLAPMTLAYAAAHQVAATEGGVFAFLDVVITDEEMVPLGRALAAWLGASYVRRISVPQEPDAALLADEMEAASVVLTPIIHGGGATVPIIRGLLAAGRHSVVVCCLVDGRNDPRRGLLVAGREIPVVAAHTSAYPASSAVLATLEGQALADLDQVLRGEGVDREFFDAVANSPGALSLGHFHSENRAWMSAVVSPSAIADPSTAVGGLIIERLAAMIRVEVESLCPGATPVVRDLAGRTPLSEHLRTALRAGAHETDLADAILVLVDWGALTGDTAVRGAMEYAGHGPCAVVVAVGVDRSADGAHHLLQHAAVPVHTPRAGQLSLEKVDTEERRVQLSFISAVRFPRDHRSEIDCPLCATERSLRQLRSMPTSSLNSRLRVLRVRTAEEVPNAETVDAFACPMPPTDVFRFLLWRQVAHRGITDRSLAHAVALRLEGRGQGISPADLIALGRNLVLNPDLVRRRPWSSPRFRHALAIAVRKFLLSNDAGSVSSDMARQLITVLRMASKTEFAHSAGWIYGHWESVEVREELEVALATMLRDNISDQLLASIEAAVAAFEVAWTNSAPVSIGALRADIARLRSRRRDGDRDMQYRWREAREMLDSLDTHMGLGATQSKLPVVAAGLHEPRTVDSRRVLLDSMLRSLHDIERFVTSSYEKVRYLIEAELTPVIRRGAADQLPDPAEWLLTIRELLSIVEAWSRDPTIFAGADTDLQRGVEEVLAPLDPSQEAKTFVALVLTTPSDLRAAVAEVCSLVDPGACIVQGLQQPANVLFPGGPLRDLLSHLVENAFKHRESSEDPPFVRFEMLTDVGHPLYRRIRVAYRGTRRSMPDNPEGGLSPQQWGGVVAAFGGTIEIVPVEQDESFAVEILFQVP